MNKVASPQELQNELRELLAYSTTRQPSRAVLAASLHDLAARVDTASPKWVEKLKAKLAANPLYFLPGSTDVVCEECLGGKPPKGAKKVPLYKVTNYNEFNTCSKCGTRYF